MRVRRGTLLFFAFALLFAARAYAADVIFDNGVSNQDDGWEMTQFYEADDFTIAERTQLSGFKFWNYARAGYFTGTVTWEIYADTGGTPGYLVANGASAASSHTPTGFSLFGSLFEAVTTFEVPSVTLDPGTYWLALHNGPRQHVTRGMFWAPTGKKRSSGTPSRSREALSDGTWYSNDYPGMSPDLAFQVFGTPVPGIAGTGFVNGSPVVRFISKLGKTYRLEYKKSLTNASWSTVPGRESIPGTGAEIQVDDPQADARTARGRFYRVSVF